MIGRVLSAGLMAVAWVVIGCSSYAVAAEKAFTIANYPVSARADNAVAAKKRAIADGEAAAFRSLLKRLVPVTAYSQLQRLRSVKSSLMLDGYAVRSERNSATEYIASLDYIFAAESVRKVLGTNGIPFVDHQAPKVVLIPAFLKAPGAKPENKLGAWGKIWTSLDVRNTLTPLSVQPLKGVIHPDTVDMLRKGDTNAERIIATEYKSERVVAAVAVVDKAAKRLHVTLTGRDAVGPLSWKYSYRLVDNDVAYAMEYAAVVSLGVLEGRWKSTQVAKRGGVTAFSGPDVPLTIRVNFNNVADWYSIRDMLQRTTGVAELREDSVSDRGANISLRFPGGGETLATALSHKGLALTHNGLDWTLSRQF